METDGQHAENDAGHHANALQEINTNQTQIVNGATQPPEPSEIPANDENVMPTEPEEDGIKYSENIVPAEQDDNSDQETLKPTAADIGVDIQEKKKKNKKKSKSKRGLNKPTGFEEFYVDAPVLPEVYKEELDLYHHTRPFTERIQTAIQRFFAKRNFHSERKDLFDKYMAHGGIDSGSKMFTGGLNKATKDGLTAAEVRDMTAIHFVSPVQGDEGDPKFVVDFEGCAKGFFSCRLPLVYDLYSLEKIQLCTSTISNFLNYLIHHDVCAEYQDDINATRALCRQAEKELWDIARANAMLPGKFNEACSTIYGGTYKNAYIGDQDWAQGLEGYKGMDQKLARQTFKFGFLANSSAEMFERYKSQANTRSISITSAVDTGLEVTELVLADRQALKIYDQQAATQLRAVGKLKARTWFHPGDPDEDLTEEEEQAGATTREVRDYEFWVEDELLQRCFVGMKFEATVRHLSFGLDFFDRVGGVYCSFYRILPNELMIGWREPGPRLPPRPKKDEAGAAAGAGARAAGDEDYDDYDDDA